MKIAEVCLLGELIEIRPAKREVQARLKPDQSVSFVPMEDLKELQRSFVPKQERSLIDVYGSYTYFAENDVLLAKITPCFENGKLSIAKGLKNGVGFGSSEFMVLRCSSMLLPEYLFYFLSRDVVRESGKLSMTGAVGHKRISPEFVQSLPLRAPPLEEQQRIVAILDEAFEGLDRARANAEANLQSAKELFDQELTLTFTEGKQGWTNGTVGDLCILKSGTTVDKSLELPSGEIPYVKVAEMNLPDNLDGIQTSIRFLNKKNVSPSQIIPAGSTIFPKRGGAILTNKKRRVLVDICADLNVMSVFPGSDIDSEFLYYFFLSTDMRKLGSGSSIPQINNYDIAPLKIAYPKDLDAQTKVTDELKAFHEHCDELCNSYDNQLQNLDDLRQSLLQKAFAGELT